MSKFLVQITDRLCLGCIDCIKAYSADEYKCFSTNKILMYHPYCDDFGPMNLSSVLRFIQMVENELTEYPSLKIIYCSLSGKRNITNAAFLVGCFLILVEKQSPDEAWSRFRGQYNFEPYRDATFSSPDFGLSLLDCWRGLACGQALGWIGATPEDGLYDLDEYEHYDSFLNGELHIVIPDKFVAFRGPKTLAGSAEYEDIGECRIFAAQYYVDIFKEIGVTTVIRLNEPEYDSSIFTSAGIEHHDLEFEDCTAPSNQIVSRFLRIVDQAPGMIAVHCKAGLGRTGTLIALYAMLAHRFRARDIMGWLRIVRPGCVIGDQQHYLCDVENKVGRSLQQESSISSEQNVARSKASSSVLAKQVSDAIERRGAARAAP